MIQLLWRQSWRLAAIATTVFRSARQCLGRRFGWLPDQNQGLALWLAAACLSAASPLVFGLYLTYGPGRDSGSAALSWTMNSISAASLFLAATGGPYCLLAGLLVSLVLAAVMVMTTYVLLLAARKLVGVLCAVLRPRPVDRLKAWLNGP